MAAPLSFRFVRHGMIALKASAQMRTTALIGFQIGAIGHSRKTCIARFSCSLWVLGCPLGSRPCLVSRGRMSPVSGRCSPLHLHGPSPLPSFHHLGGVRREAPREKFLPDRPGPLTARGEGRNVPRSHLAHL